MHSPRPDALIFSRVDSERQNEPHPAATRRKIAFVSTMNSAPWGGSEFLWSEAALRLVRSGHGIAANICGWPKEASQVSALRDAGVRVKSRWYTPRWIRPRELWRLVEMAGRGASLMRLRRWLARESPELVCISNACFADDVRVIKLCQKSNIPYVLVAQANGEHMWPEDQRARSVIEVYRNARRAFFVSQGNRMLLETQLGVDLPNAEVVRNPFHVRWDFEPAWPAVHEPLRLACVGRLDPRSKGQDLLLQVMAREPWRSRPVTLSFYGTGEMEEGLRRLAQRLGLAEQVRFCGHVHDVESIWASHHALVLPSRYEGLPLVVVEAMLCGRPVIVTDIAGNAELVEEGVSGFVAEAPTVFSLGAAMERGWRRRHEWESLGKAASRAIRGAVPADPAAVFAQKLLELAQASRKSDQC